MCQTQLAQQQAPPFDYPHQWPSRKMLKGPEKQTQSKYFNNSELKQKEKKRMYKIYNVYLAPKTFI